MGETDESSSGPQLGATAAERYLHRRCKHSFLALWSHMGIYRDQGGGGAKGDGKELCDLLVVFGNDILVFSDKACAFPNTGDLSVDWRRWYKKAILKSADQIWGAERWIRSFPERLFLDRSCKKPFPIDLPSSANIKFHRIVVAHGAGDRCRLEVGGSGSLIIDPGIVGDAHFAGKGRPGTPFTIGQIDPSRGFIHVLDDVALDTVLLSLDTTIDFIRYLIKKEEALLSGRVVWAAGEEDLLAAYLRDINSDGEHDFVVPSGFAGLAIPEGAWQHFATHPQRLAQRDADQVSYYWDDLIGTFTHHLLEGTQYRTSHREVRNTERALRFLARESRTSRRMLAEALRDVVLQGTSTGFRRTRIVRSAVDGDPHYVFLVLPHDPRVPYDRYRLQRERLLELCCFLVKLVHPDARDVIGIATEPASSPESSFDLQYLDVQEWSDDQQKEALRIQAETRLFTQLKDSKRQVEEYPSLGVPVPRSQTKRNGNLRNRLCPCGSGRKYKKCCGQQHV